MATASPVVPPPASPVSAPQPAQVGINEIVDACTSIIQEKPLRIWALLALTASAMFLGCQSPRAATPPPSAEVEVVSVVQEDVPIYSEWVATMDGYVNAQIQPQVSGYLIKQSYKEGSFVRKGQVLFEIDPRPFQAVLHQANAQLAQAQAQLGKTQLDVDRDTPLAKERAIAQSQLDNDIQANLAAKASVKAAEAQVEQAQLNLDFTHVTSLVDGIAGIAQVQIGNLVNQTAALTSVSQVNPIKAYFPISEQEYMHYAARINAHNQQEVPSDAPPFDLILADGTVYPHRGTRIMIFRMTIFTFVQVVLSLVGILSGFVVVLGLLTAKRLDGWAGLFLTSAVLTSVTGFLLPFHKFLPSHGVGIVSTYRF